MFPKPQIELFLQLPKIGSTQMCIQFTVYETHPKLLQPVLFQFQPEKHAHTTLLVY